MKQCRDCGEVKELESFSKRSSSQDGHKSTCKACDSKKNAGYYDGNPDKFKANANAFRKSLYKIVTEAKKVPCMDCGIQYPYYVMDFDHRPGETKVGNVSQIANMRSRKMLLTEMAKCDIVCSNCHRERTWQRK